MVYVLALRVAFWNAERKGHQLRSDLEQGQKAVFLLVLLLVHKIVIAKIILSGEMGVVVELIVERNYRVFC